MTITTVTDINGSPHVAIPSEILEQLNLSMGSQVVVNLEKDRITITKNLPRYTLDQLLAGMPDDYELTAEDQIWLNDSPVGLSLIHI